MTRRRVGAGLLTGAAGGLIVLSVAAPPAQAKSGISISAVPAGAGAGAAGRITVAAFGGDDAAGRQRLCVQRLAAQGWRVVLCGRVELGTGGRLRAAEPANAHGESWFRAVLERIGRNGRPEPIADLVSAPVGVRAVSAAAATAATMPVAAAPVAATSGPGAVAGSAAPLASASAVSSAVSPVVETFGFGVPAMLAVPDPAGWDECAQRQTDSKSAVSLSSVDNGIETASVVRSK